MVTEGLNLLDYSILVGYFAALLFMSYLLGKNQKGEEDYFVGGRDLSWWAVGISTAATQTSAIGFMSIPAFVAIRENGGLKILQGEFALPLVVIFITIFLLPFFRKLELISLYQYLELRFSPKVKYLISGVFLFSRGLATAVGLYMTGIVFATVFGMDLWKTIIIIGGITLIYDTLGGMKAVVYSDVLQMFILLGGAVLIVIYATMEVGGISTMLDTISGSMGDRLNVLDFSHHGLGDGGDFSFWPQLIGGFFLLSSYYGCDQTQVQRELSTKDMAATKNSLIFNGFFRFPLSLIYVSIGLALGAYVILHPEFKTGLEKPDYLVPVFIMQIMPHGIKALIFVAVLAAAMSSIDSALNSLSASTIKDFIEPLVFKGKKKTPREFLVYSKLVTVAWGCIITIFAFYVGDISSTVLESVGIVGSAFYGPILAAFILGICFKSAKANATFIGIIAGVFFNAVLHFWFKEIFWMWWNFFGFLVTIIVGLLLSTLSTTPPKENIDGLIIWSSGLLDNERQWIPKYLLLVGYFILMIVICWGIPHLLRG